MKGVKEVAVFWLEDKGWVPNLSQSLFSMYQSKSLCDTMLISSDGETIPCHSSVLAAASPYLCNLLKAATQNFLKVNIQVSIPSAVLKQVVDFIYLGRSAAFHAQLDELTAAAEQLDIGGLKTACSKWENAVGAAAVVQESHSYAQVCEPTDQDVVDAEDDDAAGDSHELVVPPGEEDINHQSPLPNTNAELPAAEEASQPTSASTQPKSTFQCLVCGRKFGQMSHLQQHSRLHTGERPYSCKHCHKRFTISSNLNRHLKIHTGERPYVCGTCYRSFNQSSHLKQHERSHAGTKPYECKICKRLFSKTSHLKRHMMLHTGEKAFKCTQCPRAFTDSSHLKEHAMIHTGERPYVCKYCQRTFTFKSSMVQHLRLHTGEKPYHCDVCNKDFARFQQLKEHKIIHTGKRSFECLECGAAFFLKEQFKAHMEAHQGSRFKFKHECSVCHRVYSKKKALEKHEIKMHSNVPALVESQAAADQSSNGEVSNAAELNNANQDVQAVGDRSAIRIKQEPVDSVADEEAEDATLDGNGPQINDDQLTSNVKFQYLCTVPSEDQQEEQKLEASAEGQQVMLQPSLQQQIEQTLLQVGYAETSEGDGDEQAQGREIQVLIVEEGFEFSDATHVPIVLQDDEAAAQ